MSAFDPSQLNVRPEMLPSNQNDPAVQFVNAWMSSAVAGQQKHKSAASRRQRRFLEQYLPLLSPRCEQVLQEMMAISSANAEAVNILRDHMLVLQQIRLNGGNIEAVRNAYVNIHGGLVLDIPASLENALEKMVILEQKGQYQNILEEVTLVRECLSHVERDQTIPAEVYAALHLLLATLLRAEMELGRFRHFEEIQSHFQFALQVYTYERYPQQYAETQRQFGNAYASYLSRDREENLERAISCYKEALRIHTYDAFPEKWANIQHKLGNVYGVREKSERVKNLEQSIQHYESALLVISFDMNASLWADIQENLGMDYLEFPEGNKVRNIERAIQCFKATLRYFTREQHPNSWVYVQNRLGMAYFRYHEGDRATNLERAIYCFQTALRVVTQDTLPREWIETHTGLGESYLLRVRGTLSENIELAIRHLTIALTALESFDSSTMHIKRIKLYNNLGEAYHKRLLGERIENLRQARHHYLKVLKVIPLHFAEYERAQLSLAYLEAAI
jgi:tetratricopeptide (TPR) repeat protein